MVEFKKKESDAVNKNNPSNEGVNIGDPVPNHLKEILQEKHQQSTYKTSLPKK